MKPLIITTLLALSGTVLATESCDIESEQISIYYDLAVSASAKPADSAETSYQDAAFLAVEAAYAKNWATDPLNEEYWQEWHTYQLHLALKVWRLHPYLSEEEIIDANRIVCEDAAMSASLEHSYPIEPGRYLELIQQKVERNWVPPASTKDDLKCEVEVVQQPNGDVVDARVIECNGDAAVQRSIENAVRRASPFPLPDDRSLYKRNLRFIFQPQL